MNLLNKTTTDRHILQIERYVQKTNRLISAAISSLNSGHSYLWSLPDDELLSVLQSLHDSGNLVGLFTNHYLTATSLNTIQDNTGASGVRAIAVAGRNVEIVDGTVSFVAPPEPEEQPEEDIT
jgi:hypothetical protein